jgi:hypothetical protein
MWGFAQARAEPMRDGADEIAAAWFEKAVACYVECHQGCPWCGASHCVFRTRRADYEQYSCSSCDFFSCHTFQDDAYFVTQGQKASSLEDAVSR